MPLGMKNALFLLLAELVILPTSLLSPSRRRNSNTTQRGNAGSSSQYSYPYCAERTLQCQCGY
jgi:hypothetical protein